MRATTIKDAKALGLIPSVTSILGILEKPQLVDWKLRQVALASMRVTRMPNEEEYAFTSRMITEAFQQVVDAADRGKDIHKALELHFQGREYDQEWAQEVQAVDQWFMRNHISVLDTERQVVNLAEGFAGTTDLIVGTSTGCGIGDYKTKKSKPEFAMTPYDGQATQIAAYHMTVYGEINDNASGFNLYISSTERGRVEGTFYTPETLRNEWEVFKHLCAIWRFRKGYDPRQEVIKPIISDEQPEETIAN